VFVLTRIYRQPFNEGDCLFVQLDTKHKKGQREIEKVSAGAQC